MTLAADQLPEPDEGQRAYSALSRMSFSRSILDCFDQLDLEISLSFQKIGSISFSYQLQADSFDRTSFELTASLGAALLQTTRIRNRQLQSFQLTGFQLSSALVSGGVQHKASYTQLGQQAWPQELSAQLRP